MLGLNIKIHSRNSFISKLFKPMWMRFVTSLHLQSKLQTSWPHMGRPFITRSCLHSCLIFCHLTRGSCLHSNHGSANTSFFVVLWLWTSHLAWWCCIIPFLFFQVNCSFFENQYTCHLLWGLLALPGRLSAFSACYLYLLCDLLFCTTITSMPVFLPRLHAPKSRH